MLRSDDAGKVQVANAGNKTIWTESQCLMREAAGLEPPPPVDEGELTEVQLLQRRLAKIATKPRLSKMAQIEAMHQRLDILYAAQERSRIGF